MLSSEARGMTTAIHGHTVALTYTDASQRNLQAKDSTLKGTHICLSSVVLACGKLGSAVSCLRHLHLPFPAWDQEREISDMTLYPSENS